MSQREVKTKIGFDVEQHKLDQVEHSLEAIKHRLDFLAAAEVIHKVAELTEQFAQFALELDVAAKSAGITVEKLQELTFAAAKSAISSEEMTSAMARLSRKLYEAKQGSDEAQKSFIDAGFTPNQIAGFKTADQALLALSDRFKGIQDPMKKTAIGLQILGRGSKNMVGFLSQGSAAIKAQGVEAEHLGAILSHDQVEALVEVEHAMHELFAVTKAFGATIAAYFAPSVKALLEDFLKWYQVNRQLIDLNIRNWIYNFTFGLGAVYEALKIVVDAVLSFSKALGIDGKILAIVASLSSMLTILFGISKALSLVGIALSVGTLAAWAAGIGAVVVVLKTLWDLLHGKNFSETWLGQMMHVLVKAVDLISTGIANLVRGGVINVAHSIGEATGLISATPALASAQGGGGSTANYSVNAPISITVPPGVDKKEAEQWVKSGIREGLGSMHREASRSLRSAKAY